MSKSIKKLQKRLIQPKTFNPTPTRKSARISERKELESDSNSDSSGSWTNSSRAKKRIKRGKHEKFPKEIKRVVVAEKIINWRWAENETHREFLIKYKEFSFFDTEWVSDKEMLSISKALLTGFIRHHDLDEAPERFVVSKDDPNFERIERMAPDFDMYTDHLQEEFYQYGILPENLIVHRVIAHRENGRNIEYLTKWRGLDYSKCTWQVSNRNLPQLDTSIDYYNLHRFYNLSQGEHPTVKTDKKLFIPPTEPLTDLKVQLNAQPESVIETGLNLHSYQLDGLNWLRSQYEQKIPCILADEMGLGKTIQTASFLYSLFKEGHSKGPFLVVCPLSTMINWERELELWAPDFYTVSYICRKDTCSIIDKYEISFKKGDEKYKDLKFHLMVTSYEAINKRKYMLSKIDWKVIVVDEAQRLKCWNTNFFHSLNCFSPNSFKLLLTGTPLQNSLLELFSLLNYMNPLKFNDEEAFAHEFAEISKEAQVKKLQDVLANHMLRRVKADVFKNVIPAKTELIVLVELTAEQKRLYKCILEKQVDELNTEWSHFAFGRLTASATFMHLRKICNHPYMFPRPRDEARVNRQGVYEQKGLVDASGKFQLLEKMLPKLKKQGHRVLIFSQMTKLLDILESFLENIDCKFERLDGNTSLVERQLAIDRFNSPSSDSFAFLLSTRAGGLGINLATADTVIVFDSDWNPHNDLQALARAHRIGQRKKVMIYRLVCRQSVEERMIEVAKKKMMLTTLVVRKNTDEKVLSEKEIEEIVRFGTEKLFSTNAADKVVYDEAAIDHLLDRDSYEDDKEKENDLPNEFLGSFKVASLAGVKIEKNVLKNFNNNEIA